jgi:hypothetical protein
VVLDDIGFDEIMQLLMIKYIKPVASFLFNDFGGDTLDSHHAFMVNIIIILFYFYFFTCDMCY